MNILADRAHAAGLLAAAPVSPIVARLLWNAVASACLADSADGPAEAADLSDLDSDAQREAVSRVGQGWTGDVVAMLPADSAGITLDWLELVTHLDDLWFPASDDLVVLHPNGEFLTVSHEERCWRGRIGG